MSEVLQEVKDAVADLQLAQGVIGDGVTVIQGGVTEAVTELHRIADRLASGFPGPTEVKDLATAVKGVAEKLRGNAESLGQTAGTLKAAVDEPDPDAVPAPAPVLPE